MGDQIRFEMPFAMDSPHLVQPELGIDRVVARGGQYSYTMNVTVLDTPDNRLLRAGILLAHRVIDGLGEWFLAAPLWRPWLPDHLTEPLGAAGDLPERLSQLIQPFRRRAVVGPVAAMNCKRSEYVFRSVDGFLGILRDDLVTVRRAGLTVSRYREVTLTPGPAMTPAQAGFLRDALTGAGGLVVEDFATLQQRIGAPASGMTDVPEPRDPDPNASLEGYVGWLFGRRLYDLVRADLAVRSGAVNDASGVLLELRGLREDLRGLGALLQPDWVDAQVGLLDQLLERPAGPVRLEALSEPYFAVVDALVVASRAPKVVGDRRRRASSVLIQALEALVIKVPRRCRALQVHSADAKWVSALDAAERAAGMSVVVGPLLGKRSERLGRRLRSVIDALRPAQPVGPGPDEQALSLLTAQQAYEAGREYQRSSDRVQTARQEFVDDWPEFGRRLKQVRLVP